MSLPIDDDELMALLREAQDGHRHVSDQARAAARAAFAWRTIDEELMELTFDSLLQDEVLVRSITSDVRVIGFQGGGFALEVERDGAELMGQVLPAAKCRVTLIARLGEPLTVHADETGFFVFPLTGLGTPGRAARSPMTPREAPLL